MERYAKEAEESRDVKYNINPKYNLESASQGRPYAYNGNDRYNLTQYKDIHHWPATENREIY
jgi:hypothetical protein